MPDGFGVPSDASMPLDWPPAHPASVNAALAAATENAINALRRTEPTVTVRRADVQNAMSTRVPNYATSMPVIGAGKFEQGN
jgi:hypothetical protein